MPGKWDGSCGLCQVLPRDIPDTWVHWEGGPWHRACWETTLVLRLAGDDKIPVISSLAYLDWLIKLLVGLELPNTRFYNLRASFLGFKPGHYIYNLLRGIFGQKLQTQK